MSVCLSVCPSLHLSIICLSVRSSIRSSVCPYVRPPLRPSISTSVRPSDHLPAPPYLRLSVYLSLYISVSLSGHPRRFLAIIHVACNCAQRIRLQAMGSNPLSGSIICPSVRTPVHPVVRGPFSVIVFVFISCVGFQRRDSFIPTVGSSGPQWGPVDIIRMCVCFSVSLFGFPRHLLGIIYVASNCAQRMQPQATVSNPLSGIIIFPSVHPSVRSSAAFCGYCICIDFQFGVLASQCIYPHNGFRSTPVGSI